MQYTICIAQLLSTIQSKIALAALSSAVKQEKDVLEVSTVRKNIASFWDALVSFMHAIKFDIFSKKDLFFPVSVSIVKAMVVVLPYIISIDNSVMVSTVVVPIENANSNSSESSMSGGTFSEICIKFCKRNLVEYSTLAQNFVVLGRPSSAAFHEKCKGLYRYREIVKPSLRALLISFVQTVFEVKLERDGGEVKVTGTEETAAGGGIDDDKLNLNSPKIVQMAKNKFTNDFGILIENYAK